MEITGKHELIRQNEEFVPETVIVIGNGVVENGWEPLRETFDEMALAMDDYPIHPRKLGLLESLSYLAMQNRWSSQQILHKIASVAVCAATDFEEMHSAFWMMQNVCQPFKQNLAQFYETAENVKLNDKAMDILVKHGLEDEETGVITSNWDSLLWDYNDQALDNLLHLHGRCSSWETLLLPTQTADENSFFMMMAKDLEGHIQASEKITEAGRLGAMQLLKSVFNPPTVESDYWEHPNVHQSYVHGRALKWMREAHKLIICGVNFHSFEHELLSVLSDKKVSDSPEKWEEVVVINPKKKNWDRVSGLLKVESELCKHVNPHTCLDRIFSFFRK